MENNTGAPITDTIETTIDTEATPEKTFTQAQLDAAISERLTRERKAAEQKIKDAVTEAEKLAKMNAEEKSNHERIKREKELVEREEGITKRELKSQALEQLAERGLPRSLAEVLPFTDADGTKAAIDAVETAFRSAVQQGVEDRLKSKTPPQSGSAALPVEPSKMTYAERADLYTRDRETYKKTFGGI